MLTALLYPLQDGDAPLRNAAREGHTTCLERLLSTPGIDINIKNKVSSCFLNNGLMAHGTCRCIAYGTEYNLAGSHRPFSENFGPIQQLQMACQYGVYISP